MTDIRWLVRSDLKQVVEIEAYCFPYPWSGDDFIRSLRERNVIGMIAEDAKHRVTGYMVYALEKSAISLLNLAVHPHHWRTGVGTALVEKLKDKLMRQKRTEITALVNERSLAAQVFLSSQGFWAERVLRDHYEECDDDAYFFRYSLSASPRFVFGGRLAQYTTPKAVGDQFPTGEGL